QVVAKCTGRQLGVLAVEVLQPQLLPGLAAQVADRELTLLAPAIAEYGVPRVGRRGESGTNLSAQVHSTNLCGRTMKLTCGGRGNGVMAWNNRMRPPSGPATCYVATLRAAIRLNSQPLPSDARGTRPLPLPQFRTSRRHFLPPRRLQPLQPRWLQQQLGARVDPSRTRKHQPASCHRSVEAARATVPHRWSPWRGHPAH